MPPLVYRNEKGEVCIPMTPEMLRAHEEIRKGFIFDSTPFTGTKKIRGAFPQMNSDRFCTDLSTNITAEVFIELPQEMTLLIQSGITVPEKYYVLHTDDDLLIVYFGRNYKVTVKTKVPKDDALENPTDEEMQRFAMDYYMHELCAQGFTAVHELQTSLFMVLRDVACRLSELAKSRRNA